MSNPASPVEVGTVSAGQFNMDVAASGTTVYLLSSDLPGTGHLRVYDASRPASPTLVGSYAWPDFIPFGAAVSGHIG